MATIYHQVRINAPISIVYEAISQPERIGTWWDKQTVTQTGRGTVLEHNPGPEHGIVRLRVVELVPNRRVEWECISSHPESSPLLSGLAHTSLSNSRTPAADPQRSTFDKPATTSTAGFTAPTISRGHRSCKT